MAPYNVLFLCTGNSACPYWPGQPMTAHWGVPDPALNLPLAKLDRIVLARRLEEIGRTGNDSAHAQRG